MWKKGCYEACQGVGGSCVITYTTRLRCFLASFPLFNCMHESSFHRMPPCLHAHSRHAHVGLERLIMARFPCGRSVAIRGEYAWWWSVPPACGRGARCLGGVDSPAATGRSPATCRCRPARSAPGQRDEPPVSGPHKALTSSQDDRSLTGPLCRQHPGMPFRRT